MRISISPLAAVALTLATSAQAAPIGVDGVIGSEWAGAIVNSITFDASAPLGNFGSPGSTNHIVAYDVYYRADSQYLYVGVKANGNTTGENFANLYFNTDLVGGSDFGIEVTNSRAFQPGVPGYYALGAEFSYLMSAGNTDTVIEMALDWSYLVSDPNNILPNALNVANGIQLRSVQAFGYSVAGGSAATLGSGPRFGTVSLAVPEPASLGLAAMALVLLAASSRRRRA